MRLGQFLWVLALAVFCAVGCADDDDSAGPVSPGEEWTIVAEGLDEAVLSIHGTAADDVWAVGANKGRGALVLHWDGAAWERFDAGIQSDLWWVHAVPNGPVFLAGADSTIVKYEDGVFERMATPGVAKHTIFGLWARSATEVWAVGAINGRDGFVWQYDGTQWTEAYAPALPLNDEANAPAFFKVWGDADSVYVVGGDGAALELDAAGQWRVLETGTSATLLTVFASEGRVTAVGGNAEAVIIEGSAASLVPAPSEGVPTLQGVCLDEDAGDWATGYFGVVLRRTDAGWETVNTGFVLDVESLHAVWVDPDGGVWACGGDVVSPSLSNGTIVRRGPTVATYASEPDSPEGGDAIVCPPEDIDPVPDGTTARRWNETLLNGVRRAIPRPTVHARNLFHTSLAFWDVWAAYDDEADGYVYTDKHTADTDGSDEAIAAARDEAMSYAAYRLLRHRYATEAGGPTTLACLDAQMDAMGYDRTIEATEGDSAAAIGNRVGQSIIDAYANDGSNEANDYADDTGYEFVNPPLVVDRPGTGDLVDPSAFQPLNLAVSVTQNGIVTDAGVQPYISPNWAYVTPWVIERPNQDAPYFDATPYPVFEDPEMVGWAVQMVETQALLDPEFGTTLDISPGGYGNNSLGADDGTGWPENPVTGEPYPENIVPEADFRRVLAEFWADGPDSETPPGHWNTLANSVSDHPEFTYRLFGEGDPLPRLEWDIKMYLALNGALHDAAIAAWELKRLSNSSRPITIVRHMAELGQSTDTTLPNYDAMGLPLIEGLIEMITPESAADGERHAHLRPYVGELALFGWRGEPGDRDNEVGGVGWVRGVDWAPYQRRNFVTPAFPGFISGHSTFSRAAAEALTELTGSPYFPKGLGEYVATANEYLVFELGPSVDVRLQWASYYDAADQAGQSRIYGGIHVVPDDYEGRRIGAEIGVLAVDKARALYGETTE